MGGIESPTAADQPEAKGAYHPPEWVFVTTGCNIPIFKAGLDDLTLFEKPNDDFEWSPLFRPQSPVEGEHARSQRERHWPTRHVGAKGRQKASLAAARRLRRYYTG